MFDIGWPELMLIGLVALVVIGPKDLPSAIYGIGKWVRKARTVAREFQTHVDDMMREAELDDFRKQAMAARHFDFKDAVEKVVDPKGEIRDATALPPVNEVVSPPSVEPEPSAEPAPSAETTPSAEQEPAAVSTPPAAPPLPAAPSTDKGV